MLIPKNKTDQKIALFCLFLDNLIQGDAKYKQSVTLVLEEAKKLQEGKVALAKIKRDYFDTIKYVRKNCGEYLETHSDIEDFSTKEYGELLKLL